MSLDRRSLIFAVAGIVPLAASTAARAEDPLGPDRAAAIDATAFGVVPDAQGDQAAALQAAVDAAAARRLPLRLAPGRIASSTIVLRRGSRLIGSGPATVVSRIGPGSLFEGAAVADLMLADFACGVDGADAAPLLSLTACERLTLHRLSISGGGGHAIALERSGGSVRECRIDGAGATGIFSLDATGLEIAGNIVERCANNGIQVWRTDHGHDGTIVANNRVTAIRADEGGSGENGNGINIFRAAGVIVSANAIDGCAFSAIRSNAGSDCQIVNNSCRRLGEVAIYAEFGFEGAIIANNLIDEAASGIAITNFDQGGRLAVCSGNVVRNLFLRDDEDQRGIGIGVEADTAVAGNVVENAPVAGIALGWGPHLRDVVASGNVIRQCGVGIAVSVVDGAGSAVVSGNLIASPARSAIQAFEWDNPVGGDLIGGAPPGLAHLSISGNVRS